MSTWKIVLSEKKKEFPKTSTPKPVRQLQLQLVLVTQFQIHVLLLLLLNSKTLIPNLYCTIKRRVLIPLTISASSTPQHFFCLPGVFHHCS
ncbi:hypothetical protein RIF29_13720 [Crotalaria pallida]|uniref:Uncharacterized protein n=1 Tax=Crotalaria pallida TaxID=3830 RepID=A0AAN9P2L0_CROPI